MLHVSTWPGRVHALTQHGQTVGYLHLIKRKVKRNWLLTAVDAVLDIAVLLTRPLSLIIYGTATHGSDDLDVYLHDARGRLLLWARKAEKKKVVDRVEIRLPDGQLFAEGQGEWRKVGRTVECLLDSSSGVISSDAGIVVWDRAPTPDRAMRWWDSAGETVTAVYQHPESNHNYAFWFTPEPALRLLAVAGALYWRTGDRLRIEG